MPFVRPGAVVGLDAAGLHRGVAPAVGDQLLGRGRIRRCRRCGAGAPGAPPRPGPKPRAGGGGVPGAGGMPERPPNIIITGTGLAAFAGVTSVIWISTVISGYGELSTAPISSLPTTGRPPTVESLGAVDPPRHLGHVLRDAAEHLAIELLDDLGTALLPPRIGAGDLAAVLQRQDFRQVGIRIRQRLVVVGVIRRGLVAARTGTQRLDAELLHHVLVVGCRGRGIRVRRRARGRLRAGRRLSGGRRRAGRRRVAAALRLAELLAAPAVCCAASTRAEGHQQRRHSHRGQPDPVQSPLRPYVLLPFRCVGQAPSRLRSWE